MSDIEKHFTKINEALDTEFVSDVPVKVEENTSIEMSVDVDYSTVRNNLYNLVATGNDAVEHILSLAKASDFSLKLRSDIAAITHPSFF